MLQTIEVNLKKKQLNISDILLRYTPTPKTPTKQARTPKHPTPQAQDVGWSVLDVALSPDGGHLVYSSWSDSLHQVRRGEEEEEKKEGEKDEEKEENVEEEILEK